MNDPFLLARLRPVDRRQRRLQTGAQLALVWLATLAVGTLLALALRPLGVSPRYVVVPVFVLGVGCAVAAVIRLRRRSTDWPALARAIEARHPELEGRLLTVVENQPAAGCEPGYFQRRLADEAIGESCRRDWRGTIPRFRLVIAHLAQGLALALTLYVFLRLPPAPPPGQRMTLRPTAGLTVTPGDTAIERGQSLVVMARFGKSPPPGVELVYQGASFGERRLPLVRSLSDPMFGGTIAEVKEEVRYRLEYAGQATRDYRVTVFEYPRLERSDATLTFPDYTQQKAQKIPDTRRLSAVEGSQLDLELQLNKPVASARLVPKGRESNAVALAVVTNRPAAVLHAFTLAASQAYDLQLVDADGRSNKVAVQFVFNVLSNRVPEIKLTSPRGDVRPSPLEELVFEGRVWDDFGVEAYGLAYTVGGAEPKLIELGRGVGAKQSRPFRQLLRLEELKVTPDQLVSWYVWADDRGPDGQLRRTSTDLYFGEIRPFEEVFREGQGQENQGEQQGGNQSGEEQGNPSARLAELQKQIINATWKLQREAQTGPAPARSATPRPSGTNAVARADYAKDVEVVRDSQEQALEQAEKAQDQADDPRTAAFWKTATDKMDEAAKRLGEAMKSAQPLPAALAAEQAAYQALLRLQQREYEVARSRRQNRGQQSGGGRQQQMQRQLDQLDLAQSENRYETERQAQAPVSPERREQLQVLNRLQELARRQQDVNERLQELQAALQQARNETEREELRRQLKRLQEEEQQMLADADELQQRLNRPENQSRLAEQRQQMEQARQNLQRAAEAAGQGSASQALAAGSRAQQQMQQARDDLRRASAGEFAEDLRTLRSETRELTRQQTEIRRQMDELGSGGRKTLSDSTERQDLLRQLAEQKRRLTNVVERATQVSEQAEASEPLVSRELYDSLRKFSQDEAGTAQQLQEELVERGLLTRSLVERLRETAENDRAKALELTAEMLRQGYALQANRAEEKAREGIADLRRGVERAADRVLGDDTEALRMAQRELDDLTRQVEREIAAGGGRGTNGPPGAAAGQAGNPSPTTPRTAQAGQNGTPSPDGNRTPEATPESGQGQGQGQAQAQGQGQREGQGGNASRPGERSGQLAQGQPSGNDGNNTGNNQPQPGTQAGNQPGQSGQPGQNQPGQPGQAGQRGNQGGNRDLANGGATRRGGNREATEVTGGGGGILDGVDRLFGDGNAGPREWTGPITGDDFAPWSDRLREVEEMVDAPQWRSEVAAARERARRLRQEFRRSGTKPDWAVVRLEIMKPLVEVRQHIADELARREPRDQLVPIDRDPVPARFSELVRRYYEDLGKAGAGGRK